MKQHKTRWTVKRFNKKGLCTGYTLHNTLEGAKIQAFRLESMNICAGIVWPLYHD